ncbi:type II toxin-antitoxin system RelE/ParE family toxin [Thiohalocapsa sp. ML1]|uniref:type II toxin-antitoxin system RelE/ParE family toxin n=1 Tax=Thiohalocapsa sp. ML1 TaxID=1431688 RepID=UPI001C1FE35C|nr:type II toxin-antitoxin system RelE/ParE family toxin [Thiohalocapsa sp. ML1]
MPASTRRKLYIRVLRRRRAKGIEPASSGSPDAAKRNPGRPQPQPTQWTNRTPQRAPQRKERRGPSPRSSNAGPRAGQSAEPSPAHQKWYCHRHDRRAHHRRVFFRTESGQEPVRDWLKSLSKADKRVIGADLKTVQYGWPIGMPVVRKLEAGLREVRSHLDRRIARILFTVTDGRMILLHGFIKKSQKTPADDLALARRRRTQLPRNPIRHEPAHR